MRLRQRQRLALVILAVLLIGGAAGLVLAALQDKVTFFVTPSQVAEQSPEPGRRFRLGGLVVEGSIRRDADGSVSFAVTDRAQQVQVTFHGLLPDLFRDGQGVVTDGTLRTDGVFEASEVLAKHDENYMPKEVADALKEAGYWNHEADQADKSP